MFKHSAHKITGVTVFDVPKILSLFKDLLRNRHVIRFSFVCLFVYVFASILLYKYFVIETVLLKQASDKNSYIANDYKTRVYDKYPEIAKKIKSTNFQNLLQDEGFIDFAKNSIDFLSSIDAYVSIYNSFGQKIITNKDLNIIDSEENNTKLHNSLYPIYVDKYFLKDYIYDNAASEAFHGKDMHSLILCANIVDANNNSAQRSLISSYIPLIDVANGRFSVLGVIEVITDITNEFENIYYLESHIVIGFVIMFVALFGIILYNTHYAQRIVNTQSKASRDLEDAKKIVEIESSTKTEFLANISHELRTPLSSIIGFSDIILSETYGKMENLRYKDYISDINNSGKHLLSMINDILDLSKACADKLYVEKIDLDLKKLVSSSVRLMQPRADKAQIELIEKLPKQNIVIKSDPKRLKQALLNLLSNAVKFTPENGTVTLSIELDFSKQMVHIIIQDTGIGILDQDIPRALAPFGQVDNSLNRKYEGTGLGLPLTKKIVELMGGVFDLQGSQGKGTTATISFFYKEIIEY